MLFTRFFLVLRCWAGDARELAVLQGYKALD